MCREPFLLSMEVMQQSVQKLEQDSRKLEELDENTRSSRAGGLHLVKQDLENSVSLKDPLVVEIVANEQ